MAGSLSNYCPFSRWHSHELSLKIHPKARSKALAQHWMRTLGENRVPPAWSWALAEPVYKHTDAWAEIWTRRANPLLPRSQPGMSPVTLATLSI